MQDIVAQVETNLVKLGFEPFRPEQPLVQFPKFKIPKMYFLVNGDLPKLDIGKISAQVGHAAFTLGTRFATLSLLPELANTKPMFLAIPWKQWHDTGNTKIVLRSTERQMSRLRVEYKDYCTCVNDAGRTKFKPGSFTVMGFVPLDSQNIPLALAYDLDSLKLLD
jgi:peptidyl-tRNA hydrolase